MKKLALLFVLVLGLNSMWAQEQRGGQRMSIEDRQAQELKTLKKNLNLDKEQEKAIIKFQDAFAKEVNTLRSGMSQGGDRSAMREKMNTLRTKYDADVRKVLNDEQKVKYDEMFEKRASQMQKRQGKGNRQGNNMNSKL